MQRANQPTCGQGLASGAALPAKLAELLASRADVLERHTQALDPSEQQGQQELAAYTALARAHRHIAAELSELAHQMAGYRDLPMAEHDMAVMTDPGGQAAAFQRFVAIQRELRELLQEG